MFQPSPTFGIGWINRLTIIVIKIKELSFLVIGHLKITLLFSNNIVAFFFFAEFPRCFAR